MGKSNTSSDDDDDDDDDGEKKEKKEKKKKKKTYKSWVKLAPCIPVVSRWLKPTFGRRAGGRGALC